MRTIILTGIALLTSVVAGAEEKLDLPIADGPYQGTLESLAKCWDDRQDTVTWRARFATAGVFKVTAVIASPGGVLPFALDVGDKQIQGKTVKTDWADFKTVELGPVTVDSTAAVTVAMHAVEGQAWSGIDFRSVTFTKMAAQ